MSITQLLALPTKLRRKTQPGIVIHQKTRWLGNNLCMNLLKNSPYILKMADCYSIFASILASSSSNSTLIHQFYDSTAIWLGYQRFENRFDDEPWVGTPIGRNLLPTIVFQCLTFLSLVQSQASFKLAALCLVVVVDAIVVRVVRGLLVLQHVVSLTARHVVLLLLLTVCHVLIVLLLLLLLLIFVDTWFLVWGGGALRAYVAATTRIHQSQVASRLHYLSWMKIRILTWRIKIL